MHTLAFYTGFSRIDVALLLLVAAVILVPILLAPRDSSSLWIASYFGIVVGFVVWVFDF